MRTLTTLLGNSQKLDGGAMFGNAPRALWSRWMQPDAENRIDLGCRALLVRDGERNVLVETGIGAFFPPALRQRYGVQEERHVLLDSLAAVGLDDADIDVVLLTHLHFDHAGGLLAAWEEGQPRACCSPTRISSAAAATGSARASRTRATAPRSCRNCSTCCRPADAWSCSTTASARRIWARAGVSISAKAIPRARCSRRSPCPTARWYSAAT